MAAIWWNSSTFNHCLLIPPIIAWLVWQRLPELRRLDARRLVAGPGCWSAPARSAGCSARRAASTSPAMLGLLVMLQGAVIACLGKAVTRGLAFPLVLRLVPGAGRARSWCR